MSALRSNWPRRPATEYLAPVRKGRAFAPPAPQPSGPVRVLSVAEIARLEATGSAARCIACDVLHGSHLYEGRCTPCTVAALVRS